jgi:Domain of unknown function (DUF4185)
VSHEPALVEQPGQPSPIGPHSALLQRQRWRRFQHAVVLQGTHAVHYRRSLARPDEPWRRVGTVSDDAVAAVDLDLLSGRLTARVLESIGAAVYQLRGAVWRRVDEATWHRRGESIEVRSRPELMTALASPFVIAPLSPSTVLVAEGESVFSYHRRRDGEWVRSACLQVVDSDVTPAAHSSTKVAQVTGELDATAGATGVRRATLSRSLSSAGIRGTDLGVCVEHDGRRFLLFGDTHWTRPWLVTRDSIAEVLDSDPLPVVRFHGSPLRVSRATMGEYDVPLDAISVAGQWYGFFSSDHFRNGVTMGRSVLARARNPHPVLDANRRHHPVRFDGLATVSDRHFINISAQLRPAREVPGAGGDGEVVLLWGTGSYRASELRLAMLPVAALPQRRGTDLSLQFWDGSGWSESESDAAPLFGPAALGEISVRWVPEVGRYLLLSMSGPADPAGMAVTLRWADRPAGPWTPRLSLMDWVAVGMVDDVQRRFIKARAGDPVSDDLFGAQARSKGGAYAPYLFDVRRDGAELVLRYTLSTWNPYQVVLMQHRLVPGEF